MRTIDKIITKVDCSRGTRMGRDNIGVHPAESSSIRKYRVYGTKVPMSSDGCYDRGHTYWGIGVELRVQYTRDLSYIRFYRKGE